MAAGCRLPMRCEPRARLNEASYRLQVGCCLGCLLLLLVFSVQCPPGHALIIASRGARAVERALCPWLARVRDSGSPAVRQAVSSFHRAWLGGSYLLTSPQKISSYPGIQHKTVPTTYVAVSEIID